MDDFEFITEERYKEEVLRWEEAQGMWPQGMVDYWIKTRGTQGMTKEGAIEALWNFDPTDEKHFNQLKQRIYVRIKANADHPPYWLHSKATEGKLPAEWNAKENMKEWEQGHNWFLRGYRYSTTLEYRLQERDSLRKCSFNLEIITYEEFMESWLRYEEAQGIWPSGMVDYWINVLNKSIESLYKLDPTEPNCFANQRIYIKYKAFNEPPMWLYSKASKTKDLPGDIDTAENRVTLSQWADQNIWFSPSNKSLKDRLSKTILWAVPKGYETEIISYQQYMEAQLLWEENQGVWPPHVVTKVLEMGPMTIEEVFKLDDFMQLRMLTETNHIVDQLRWEEQHGMQPPNAVDFWIAKRGKNTIRKLYCGDTTLRYTDKYDADGIRILWTFPHDITERWEFVDVKPSFRSGDEVEVFDINTTKKWHRKALFGKFDKVYSGAHKKWQKHANGVDGRVDTHVEEDPIRKVHYESDPKTGSKLIYFRPGKYGDHQIKCTRKNNGDMLTTFVNYKPWEVRPITIHRRLSCSRSLARRLANAEAGLSI